MEIANLSISALSVSVERLFSTRGLYMYVLYEEQVGPSVFYAPLGLGFRVRVGVRVRVRSVISESFRVRVRVMVIAEIW